MVKYFIGIFLWVTLCFATISNGQGISNIWMGGYGNPPGIPPWGGWKMDFYSGSPVISHEIRSMNFNFTGTTISDSSGNFLFATNGVIVMNSQGDTMLNGSGLNPGFYSSSQWFGDGLRIPQGAMILPLPESNTEYYIFHMTWDTVSIQPFAYNFYYSTVDMNLDNGYGAVVLKNNIAFTGSLSSNGISACKHANGRDWWINIHDSYGTDFHLLLLTPTGVTYKHSQTFGYREGLGAYGFSPDGSKFGGYNTTEDFEIFDFDRCSGLLSNFRQVVINDSSVTIGCSFSPNSKYLYGSSLRYLYQIDTDSNQPDTSLQTVAEWDGTYYNNAATTFGLASLAPDGCIYLTTASTTPYMHKISSPDSFGIGCSVLQNAITLPSFNNGSVPNHPNYFLGALTGSPCDTLVGIHEQPIQENISELYVYYSSDWQSAFINAKNLKGTKRHLEIFDQMGRSVFLESGHNASQFYTKNFNCSSLSVGIYLVTLTTEKERLVKRFVVE